MHGHDGLRLLDSVAGARGRTRTGTPVKASGPKPGASTNFATRARSAGARVSRRARGRLACAECRSTDCSVPPAEPRRCRCATPALPVTGRRFARFTRNQAAYMAGSDSSVSAVATIRPPMIATAIGPQNTLRDNGIIASTAAAAVSTIGRKRRTAASTIAFQVSTPLGAVLLDLVDQDHRIAHDHAHQRDHAEQRDEAERPVQQQQRAGHARDAQRRRSETRAPSG